MTDGYIPGVCNIGPAEIRQRRNVGVGGAVAAAVTLTALVAAGVPKPWRAVVALPAAAGASGLLQAQLHFCSGFGMRGVFNMGPTGRQDTVDEAEFRRADQRKALGILGAASAIGAAVAAAGLLLPRGAAAAGGFSRAG